MCALAERAELDAAKNAGTASITQMLGWLAGNGVEMTRGRLNNHFQSRHHELA